MKKRMIVCLAALCVLAAMSACSCDEGGDVVFVNGSDVPIAAVSAGFQIKGETAQKATGSSLERGESFGFEVDNYPVVVVAYSEAQGNDQSELGRITLYDPPNPGKRWYVTARNGESGLIFTADSRWPEGI